MKTKILVSFLIMALVCCLVGGATFAYFTDTTTNADNSFQTGTIDVNFSEDPLPIVISNMAPGDEYSGSFDVKNDGSLKMWFNLTCAFDQISGNTLFSIASDKASFEIYEDAAHTTLVEDDKWFELDAENSMTFNYKAKLDSSALNEYQNLTGDASITVNAQQYDYNLSHSVTNFESYVPGE